MDKMPELKPCPFCGCGSIPEYVPRKTEGLLNAPWRVHCATCGADGRRAENEKTAIAAWNARADLPKDVDIQDLKRKDLSPFDSFGMSVEERYARRLKKEGWNDCLDHLVALGVIKDKST